MILTFDHVGLKLMDYLFIMANHLVKFWDTLYSYVESVFKDHPWKDQKVVNESRWSFLTSNVVLRISHWDTWNVVFNNTLALAQIGLYSQVIDNKPFSNCRPMWADRWKQKRLIVWNLRVFGAVILRLLIAIDAKFSSNCRLLWQKHRKLILMIVFSLEAKGVVTLFKLEAPVTSTSDQEIFFTQNA